MARSTPTIHSNGTSKEALLAQVDAAHSALRNALEALSMMSPNARDYYPQGHAAFSVACQEHEARLAAVRKVWLDIEDFANRINGAGR